MIETGLRQTTTGADCCTIPRRHRVVVAFASLGKTDRVVWGFERPLEAIPEVGQWDGGPRAAAAFWSL